MLLRELIDGLDGARLVGDGAVAVRAVTDDSRKVERGDLFVAVRGSRSDGHAFVPTAIERGASAIVVEHSIDGVAIPQVIVPHGARALGVLVARTLGDPASKMILVGVTGTNGKTTTTYLIESILNAAGAKPGVIGTVNYRYGGQVFDSPYTTPTPAVLHETFAQMLAAGCTHVVMEVSSAALVMDRLAGLAFTVGAFSNLTQDHLDVHGTMEAYRDAKRLLFSRHLAASGTAVVNVDDPEGDGMGAAAGAHRVLRVSAKRDADLHVIDQESTVRGIRARVSTPRGPIDVESKPLVGGYNVDNLALAIGIAEALGIDHATIARGIASLPGVPGRVERVANDADLDILVDYAHTPDALRNVLTALRPLTKRRLICVFGCGGDRDPTKRPKMGAAVAELADLAVVTSDNPRTEDPRAIIDAIVPAVPNAFVVDPDRRNAIRAAIAEATPGDVVVIAGKGHEDYQILGTTKIHFDDREEAAAAVALRTTRVIIDSRIAAPGDLYVAIRGETHDGHAFVDAAIDRGATAVMVERGRGTTRVRSIEVDDTRIALGEMARDHRRAWRGTLVAITGSAGKTTTKELTAAALRGAATTHAAVGSLNNETGVPLTLLGLRPFHRYGVIEMGMRGRGQIEYLTKIAEPDVAVVVNAGTAHIELLGSTDAIAEAKSEIWLGLRNGGTVVRPVGDARLAKWAGAHAHGAKTITFGDEAGADVRLTSYAATGPHGSHLDLEIVGAKHTLHLPLLGRHAAIDACCAIASAIACGVSIGDALRGLARAKPAAMRGEVVEIHGRRVIVDCYNANPASMEASLRTLAELAQGKQGVAVLGDMLELGDHARAAHDQIGTLAAQLGMHVIALGAWKDTVAAPSHGATTDDPIDAAARAMQQTKPGDWILVKASRGMRLERVVAAMREVVA
ncbi:MAG TPA: UDP-N-acetylmuramoyl-L-alanyl-D-glutamate--2,6-diaminopimelate ligase [Kofleriaceae bacterium]|nr:UDP-N-acetylmuramoyl-L-alanyl-D-glutamate--2,6-diaminopimelate ligase [Kofleriaceae bacterium]